MSHCCVISKLETSFICALHRILFLWIQLDVSNSSFMVNYDWMWLKIELLFLQYLFRENIETRVESSGYKEVLTLVIKKFSAQDVGTYTCISTNSFGRMQGTIRLYGKKNNSIHSLMRTWFCMFCDLIVKPI